jgi:hypothetical protein
MEKKKGNDKYIDHEYFLWGHTYIWWPHYDIW